MRPNYKVETIVVRVLLNKGIGKQNCVVSHNGAIAALNQCLTNIKLQ